MFSPVQSPPRPRLSALCQSPSPTELQADAPLFLITPYPPPPPNPKSLWGFPFPLPSVLTWGFDRLWVSANGNEKHICASFS